ncbi:MAG: hydrogenase 4 subunit F [Candidatus Aramenus sp.]|nr:hydrogenase 4 subunit F [Candidatus Aramenus sp.]
MKPEELEVLCLVVLPLLANALFLKGIKYSSVASGVAELVLSSLLYFHLPVVNPFFYVTGFTWYFVVIVASIYLLSSLYSLKYLKGERTRLSERDYFALLNFFASSMFFALVVNNLGLMWVGLEATTVSTVLLVTVEGSETAVEAGWRYLLVISSGISLAFISVILVYYSLHTLEVSSILAPHSSLTLKLASALALVGFGTKVGIFPVNTWLPDAHSESPAPVSALFSGTLLPVALYVMYMVYQVSPLPSLYSAFAIASIAIASISMSSQTSFKRLFAYSSIENMNLALLGLVSGSVLGAIVLLVAHAFGKAGAFYSSGVVYKSTGSKRIDGYGLWRLKLVPYSLILSSLAVTGTPPFGTFVGEFLILSSLAKYSPLEFSLLVPLIAVAFISVNFHVSRMVFKGEGGLREDVFMGAISLASSVVSLAIGVFAVWWLGWGG